MIRIFPVCYSVKHFLNSNILFENRKRKVFDILEHLQYLPLYIRFLSCMYGGCNGHGMLFGSLREVTLILSQQTSPG